GGGGERGAAGVGAPRRRSAGAVGARAERAPARAVPARDEGRGHAAGGQEVSARVERRAVAVVVDEQGEHGAVEAGLLAERRKPVRLTDARLRRRERRDGRGAANGKRDEERKDDEQPAVRHRHHPFEVEAETRRHDAPFREKALSGHRRARGATARRAPRFGEEHGTRSLSAAPSTRSGTAP